MENKRIALSPMRNEQNFSRREFLRTAVLGGVFLAELSLPKEIRAQLEKLLASQEFIKEDFEAGLERLRKEVFMNSHERFFVFVKKGETAGWVNIEDVMSDYFGKSVDLLPLLEDRGMEEMHFVHTHPFIVAEKNKLLTPRVLKEIRDKEGGPYPFVPSEADIELVIKQRDFLDKLGYGGKLKHSVLDPAGRWTYDVDMNHPKIKKLQADIERRVPQEKLQDGELLIGGEGDAMLIELGVELLNRQDQFYKNGGISYQTLGEFARWLKESWGVIVTFTPYSPRGSGQR